MEFKKTTEATVTLGDGDNRLTLSLVSTGGHVDKIRFNSTEISAEDFDRVALAISAYREEVRYRDHVYPRYCCADHGYYAGPTCKQCRPVSVSAAPEEP